MLTLNDGRNELWQWDTKRTLSVDADCTQVHFSNKVFGRSIDMDVVDGIAIIPDILLQTDKDLTAWAFVGTTENGYTKISKVFKVNKRNKPSDYVFTPLEQTTLGELKERLDKIEESQDPDAIKNAVEDYLEQNPVEVPVQSVNGQTGEVKLTAGDVGAISYDDLQEATNKALEQAKESGEFDGADGQPGADGLPGQDGSDGITPHIGDNGNWFIGETDTGNPSRGIPGEPGKDGSDGKDGSAGADGISPTVAVSKSGKVTTVSITDKNGTKTATINDGADGSDGNDGTSVTVKSVSESTEDGGSNVVTFSDGKTLTVKNGKAGTPGKTPVKGTDYFTAADKAELVSAVISALPVYDGEVI